MSKQTALDFFFQQISETLGFDSEVYEIIEKTFDEAKQMEKEQIVNAVDGFPLHTRDLLGDDYYKELYGNG